MLQESLVSSILQSSLTGAGPVLTIYTLILPISGRLFEKRVIDFIEGIEDIKTKLNEMSKIPTSEDLESVRVSIEEIEKKLGLPSYLGIGMALTFFGFLLSCIISIFWYRGYVVENLLIVVFGGTILLFLLIGIITIKDIYEILKIEYKMREKIFNKLKENSIGERPSVVN